MFRMPACSIILQGGEDDANRNLSILGALLMAGSAITIMAVSEIGRGDRYSGTRWATRSPVIATHGMAATAQPLATQIAIDILKRGGTAVDAAIAVNAALGLMEPVSCGIGGDLFAMVWDPGTHKLYGLNGSGTICASTVICRSLLRNSGAAAISRLRLASRHRARNCRLLVRAAQKFGKLPIADDLAPAIAYAREGFPVSQLIADYWTRNMAAFEKSFAGKGLEEIANARATYLVNGHAPGEGEIFRNPDLAATYEKIAKGGRVFSTKAKSPGLLTLT